MPRAPWELTRDMFLAPHEADRLLAHVRTAATADSADPLAAADLTYRTMARAFEEAGITRE